MEIKIPKEVRQHKETIFFGLSVRQFICAVLAVGTAVGVYFLLKTITGPETASWACIVAAAPVAVTGFFQYNGMTFEQFLFEISIPLRRAQGVPVGKPLRRGADEKGGTRL